MGYLTSTTGLILVILLFELSGGDDFAPQSERLAKAAPPEAAVTTEAPKQYQPFVSIFDDTEGPTFTPQFHVYTASYGTADAVETVISTRSAPITMPADDTGLVADNLSVIVGDWVNLRSGPGTNFDVIDTYPGGTRAEVLQITTDDWAEIRLPDENVTGWMAAWLLSN